MAIQQWLNMPIWKYYLDRALAFTCKETRQECNTVATSPATSLQEWNTLQVREYMYLINRNCE